jgi:hypothetical protein
VTDILRSHLTDLAEEVVSVDLRDRSISTARRIGARRAVVATSAAAALVAVAAVAAYALRPATQNTMPPASTPTVSTPPTTVPAGFGGTTYYYVRTGDRYQVLSFAGGQVSEHHAITAPAGDACVGNSLIVSPDGAYLAWVEGGDGASSVTGTLTVSRIDGTEPHQVPGVYCSFDEADWIREPLRLRVSRTTGQPGYVDVDPATGRTTPATRDGIVWSANRTSRAIVPTAANAPVTVEGPFGQSERQVEYEDNPACGFEVRAVSDDGQRLIIGRCNTDPGRNLFGYVLLDTTTGRPVELPEAAVVGFVGDNLLLRTSSELVLVTPSGQDLDRIAEPAGLAQARLIGYKP